MDAFTPQQTTDLVSRIGCKKIIDRKESQEGHPNNANTLPSSGAQMGSGIGKELSAEQHTHRKGEPSPIEGQAV